ncbi:hypothetical protein Cni_G27501 [Canna indica]|uniref:Uncharacterized protein n=1 Tax=Canna indica TaxID=4628 RepID=A0AAQ3QPD1_9LILI|nr:hypothetical protein Cni_G27501 [Canna indica]
MSSPILNSAVASRCGLLLLLLLLLFAVVVHLHLFSLSSALSYSLFHQFTRSFFFLTTTLSTYKFFALFSSTSPIIRGLSLLLRGSPTSRREAMELHSHHATAKKLWNYLRVAFFMMRKGFASKRRLLADMNLLMKRGKLLGKSLLLSFHHPRPGGHNNIPSSAFARPREYEFSCSNSPNPVFYHGRPHPRRHHYFPCLHAVVEDDDAAIAAVALPRIEYSSPQYCTAALSLSSSQDLAPGEQRTPLSSPFSVRIVHYSSEDDEDQDAPSREVDDDAEEFIKRFYEQLQAQSRIALLHYQELEYQAMLARGL